MINRLRIVAAIVLASSAAVAETQKTPAPPPAPAAVPSVPQSTSATFGDWVLNCQRVGDAPQQNKLCEVVQTLTTKGQNAPVARIAIGRLGTGEPLRITAVVPVNVAPATAPRLVLSDKANTAASMAWQRCVPVGCFAAATLDEPNLQKLRGTSEPSHIAFHDGLDREASLPLSPRGLPQALDALNHEDTAK
jgi:invasion protein IalB